MTKTRFFFLSLIIVYLFCLHGTIFWWTLSGHASCSNGPDGSDEWHVGGQYIQVALVSALAVVILRAALVKDSSLSRKLIKVVLQVFAAILVTTVAGLFGPLVYGPIFHPILCWIGPQVVHEPSCFHCWCGPCGG